MLNFAAVALEFIWMMCNKISHGDEIPEWEIITTLICSEAQIYWEAGKARREK